MTIDLSGHNGNAPADYNPETGEVLDEDAPDTGGWDRERHCATDLRGVDWAGRKLRAAQEQLALNTGGFDAETQHLKWVYETKLAAARARLATANAPFLKTVAFMETAIRIYAGSHRAEVLKDLPKDRKSRAFSSGLTVAYQKRRDGYFWDDALKESERKAKLLAWAKGEGEIGKPLFGPGPEMPLLENIKSYLSALDDDHAEVPPGLKYVEPGEELVIWTDLSKEEGK